VRLFVGTNFGHGAAAAAISSDGKLIRAVEEGRLIDEKDSSRFPVEALGWVLGGQPKHTTTIWTEGWNPVARLLFKGAFNTLRYGLGDRSYWRDRLLRETQRYRTGRREFRRWRSRLGAVSWLGHHLAHALSLLPAGLPPGALVLVSDTTGERAAVSSFLWSGDRMSLLVSSPFPHSIGGAFHRLAHHLGFRGRTGPGKLMALSAFGEPRWVKDLKTLASVRKGAIAIDLARLPSWHRSKSWLKLASALPRGELRQEIERCRGRYEEGVNLAASAQAWFTELTWECLLQAQDLAWQRYRRRAEHLGLVGGAALNCQANGEFLRRAGSAGFGSVTVSPWSSDPGTAIGAAVHSFLRHQPAAALAPCGPYLGPAACDPSVTAFPEAISLAVDQLLAGAVVALVSGRLEFGPRALGGRCLLADARRPQLRDLLNRMKSRPDFMPIAPAVLAEDFNRYFVGLGSHVMAWTVEARPLTRRCLPAAVHRNGGSRVQVVGPDEAPLLDKVLRAFRCRTGHGVLLLTSLNGSGEAMPPSLSSADQVARRLGAAGLLSDEGWISYE
jgi:carbamoyltransferase